jgi:hypothetical protein
MIDSPKAPLSSWSDTEQRCGEIRRGPQATLNKKLSEQVISLFGYLMCSTPVRATLAPFARRCFGANEESRVEGAR